MEIVIVHRCHDDIEADLIRQLLESEMIPCQVVSNVPHSVFPLTFDGLGEVRIGVLVSEADRARKLIAQFFDSPDPSFSADPDESLEPSLE